MAHEFLGCTIPAPHMEKSSRIWSISYFWTRGSQPPLGGDAQFSLYEKNGMQRKSSRAAMRTCECIRWGAWEEMCPPDRRQNPSVRIETPEAV